MKRIPSRVTSGLTLLLCLMILPVQAVLADYTTPGIGQNLTMTDLVFQSGGAVTGGGSLYQVHQKVIISLTDTLSIAPGQQLVFNDTSGLLGLEINGALLAHGTPADSVRFLSSNQDFGDYHGIEFRETGAGSACELKYCVLAHATRAIDVYGATALVEHCRIHHTSEVAVDLGASDSVIRNCRIHDNFQRTFTMTLGSSPVIENNVLVANNLENVHPYPFINVGLQGNNSPHIRGNTIRGGSEMSGGIAIWNSCDGVIEDNLIIDCGYGILCYQTGASPRIIDNVLSDNNIHPDTVNWGFGIACNGNNAPIVMGNRISGHHYGVAIINGGQPNLGDLINDFPGDDGMNEFLGNGIGGAMYEVYNNTAGPIMAQNNWWGSTDPIDIEDRIFHQVDDPLLGLVDFDQYLLASTAVGQPGIPQSRQANLTVLPASPNPFNPRTGLRFSLIAPATVLIEIYDIAGRNLRRLASRHFSAGTHTVEWNGVDAAGRSLASGQYFYRVESGEDSVTGKLMLVR